MIQIGPGLSAGVGADLSLSGGSVTGTAEATISGDFEPVYVTDFSSHVIPGIAVTSDSGFDYLTAPGPEAALADLAAIAGVMLLRLRPSYGSSRAERGSPRKSARILS